MLNRIQLKNIKYAAFASEETHCYEASVYFDGKKVGTVSNDGHGGGDYEYPTDKAAWAKLNAYIKTLPETVTTMPDHKDPSKFFSYAESLEGVCHELVNEFLIARDLKRALSKKVLFQKIGNDSLFETKAAPKGRLSDWIDQIAAREDTAEVLNLLPIEKALEIYAEI